MTALYCKAIYKKVYLIFEFGASHLNLEFVAYCMICLLAEVT
jgi:hypothetical protein